jgi:NADPH:quinone reductase-like Zn-dependent oxidoreductase
VCNSVNAELVEALGSVKTMDYAQEDFTQLGETYDVIFDAVRKLSSSSIQGSLNKGGIYLSVSSPTSEKVENLLFLKDLIEAGKIRAVIDRHYPFEKIPEAHRYVEKGHKKGNVAITVVDHGKT